MKPLTQAVLNCKSWDSAVGGITLGSGIHTFKSDFVTATANNLIVCMHVDCT